MKNYLTELWHAQACKPRHALSQSQLPQASDSGPARNGLIWGQGRSAARRTGTIISVYRDLGVSAVTCGQLPWSSSRHSGRAVHATLSDRAGSPGPPVIRLAASIAR